jgi:hypothetical protein
MAPPIRFTAGAAIDRMLRLTAQQYKCQYFAGVEIDAGGVGLLTGLDNKTPLI